MLRTTATCLTGVIEILHAGKAGRMRRMVEAAYITTAEATNHREGFIRLISDSVAGFTIIAAGRQPWQDQ